MKYQELANHSRVWIYQSNRKLTDREVSEIEENADEKDNDGDSDSSGDTNK